MGTPLPAGLLAPATPRKKLLPVKKKVPLKKTHNGLRGEKREGKKLAWGRKLAAWKVKKGHPNLRVYRENTFSHYGLNYNQKKKKSLGQKRKKRSKKRQEGGSSHDRGEKRVPHRSPEGIEAGPKKELGQIAAPKKPLFRIIRRGTD